MDKKGILRLTSMLVIAATMLLLIGCAKECETDSDCKACTTHKDGECDGHGGICKSSKCEIDNYDDSACAGMVCKMADTSGCRDTCKGYKEERCDASGGICPYLGPDASVCQGQSCVTYTDGPVHCIVKLVDGELCEPFTELEGKCHNGECIPSCVPCSTV